MIHSILIIGQSNMAGRGFKDEVERIDNNKLLAMRNGMWRPMFTPVNPDRVTAGVNLVESFADAYSKDHDVEVGIIPCADGGTRLEQWAPGGLLFDHAVLQAKLAQRTSEIVAVLWHQGESDCYPYRYPVYKEKCLEIFRALKKELNLEDVPFIVGGLGSWLADYPTDDVFKNYIYVNEALEAMATETDWIGFASAEGLGCNPDYMHFNAKALREFGLRYYNVFRTLENKDKVFHAIEDGSARVQSYIELL